MNEEIDQLALKVSQASPYTYPAVKAAMDKLRSAGFDFSKYSVHEIAQNIYYWELGLAVAKNFPTRLPRL